MQQNVSSKVFIAVVAAVVVVAAGIMVWIYRAPSISPPAKPPSRAEVNAAMKEAHSGPTSDQLQQIKEWKKTHPGAYTRY